ncbi:MAG: DUF2807 domain-containing protein [Flavobacterium sp.]|uniref:head GIN domain-containing protein n=1 Tax=Flavobacterium sp. TaxID=239 RepID=UPI0022BDDCD1|nr:head GIN domain-containing protein [Flavobacterium sp.]MCZ8198711.1 DUF2807 domain-containing protein [Flavobacterium sp.]
MKKLVLLSVFMSISLANAQNWKGEKIKGNGVQTTITRTTESYDEISAGGSFKVELVAGKEGTITISGDENIISHIVTEVNGSKLKIGFEKNKNYSYHSDIVITVPFEEISAVSFAGSGEIVTKDTITANNFEANLTGSGDGDITVNTKKLTTSLTGSGDLKISGTTEELEAKVAGSGDLSCSKLTAQNADVSVAGSGDLKVNCINKLKATVAGSGNIHYKSKPATIDSKVSGSGDITSY